MLPHLVSMIGCPNHNRVIANPKSVDGVEYYTAITIYQRNHAVIASDDLTHFNIS